MTVLGKLNGCKLHPMRECKTAAKLPFWNGLTDAQLGIDHHQPG